MRCSDAVGAFFGLWIELRSNQNQPSSQLEVARSRQVVVTATDLVDYLNELQGHIKPQRSEVTARRHLCSLHQCKGEQLNRYKDQRSHGQYHHHHHHYYIH